MRWQTFICRIAAFRSLACYTLINSMKQNEKQAQKATLGLTFLQHNTASALIFLDVKNRIPSRANGQARRPNHQWSGDDCELLKSSS